MSMSSLSPATNEEVEHEPCALIDGIRWVSDWGLENLHFALSYAARPDDLFIVTYPRSGTTWMQNIVYNLLTGGQSFDTDRDRYFQQNPHLEIDGELGLRLMQRPGAIKTHLPLDRVSDHLSAKYICVIRNPKDVCVSYSVFYNMWPEVPKLPFDRFFEAFMKGQLPFNDYFEVLRCVWQQRHRSNVLLISYEEMRTNTRPAVVQIADFLGIKLDDRLIERVLAYSSFSYMKENFDQERRKFEENIIQNMGESADADWRSEIFMGEEKMTTVRKGEINDWKCFLSDEQSRRIDDRFKEVCADCDGLENYWSKWNIFST